MFQDGRPRPTVTVHDDVLRRTAGRLAYDQFPALDGTASDAAQETDVVPALRRQVFI